MLVITEFQNYYHVYFKKNDDQDTQEKLLVVLIGVKGHLLFWVTDVNH
jgi:hypothetical protein